MSAAHEASRGRDRSLPRPDELSPDQRRQLAELFLEHADCTEDAARRRLTTRAGWDKLLWGYLGRSSPGEATATQLALGWGAFDFLPPVSLSAPSGLLPEYRVVDDLGRVLPGRDPKAAFSALQAVVPAPADAGVALAGARILYGDRLPEVLRSRPTTARDTAEPADVMTGTEAARRVRRGDDAVALEWLESGRLPKAIEALCHHGGQLRGEPELKPIRRLADLPERAGAIVSFSHPRTISAWDDLERGVFRHAERMAAVLGWEDAPTLSPNPEALADIAFGPEGAAAYHEQLLIDADDRAEWWIDARGKSEEEACRLAANYQNRGLGQFVAHLEVAQRWGAQTYPVLEPVPVETKKRYRYQAVREDLSPDPELFMDFLARSFATGAGLQTLRPNILRMVGALRATSILSVSRDCVVDEEEGLVLLVRALADKKGVVLGFIARAWTELFGIDLDWFPEVASPNPSQRDRDRLSWDLVTMCERYRELTGTTIPRGNPSFWRPAYIQSLWAHLSGLEFHALRAQLGQRHPDSLWNYARPSAAAVAAGHGANWPRGRGG